MSTEGLSQPEWSPCKYFFLPKPPAPQFPPLISNSVAEPLSVLGVVVVAISVAMAMNYMAAANRYSAYSRSSNYGYARSSSSDFVPAYLDSAAKLYGDSK